MSDTEPGGLIEPSSVAFADPPARLHAGLGIMPPRAPLRLPQPAFVLADVVATVFLRRAWLLLAFLVPVLLGLAAAIVVPVRYTAEGLLIVLGSRESAGAQDISGYGPAVLSIDQPKIVQSEINIIQSDDVIADAVRRIGPDTLYPAVARHGLLGLAAEPEAVRLQRATELFARNLHAAVETGSSIIRVEFGAPDRALAEAALRALFDAYFTRRQVIYDNATASYLTAELQRTTQALADVAGRTAAIKARIGVVDVGQALQLAGSRIDGIELRTNQVREQQATSLGQLASARAQLARQTERVFASRETTNQAANDDTRNTLLRLRVERDHMATDYAPGYPPLQELDHKIATVQGALAASARASFFTTREVRNPALDTLQEKAVSLQVATDSLDAQLAELERQTQDARARSNALLAAESDLAALQRQQAGLDAIYRQFATREAGARIEEQAVRARSANVHVVQQPVAAIAGRSMAASFGLIGVLAGAAAAAAAAVVLTWLRQVYASPAEAERSLALPQLARFAVADRFDVKDASPAVSGLAAMLLDLAAGSERVSLVQFLSPADADGTAMAALVRATAVEMARGHDRKTLLVDLHSDGLGHLALLGAQPLRPLEAQGEIVAMNTVYPRLWIAFDAQRSSLADVHAAQSATRAVIAQLRHEFDHVLVIGSADLDAYAIRRFTVLADANVVVVRGERTRAPRALDLRDTILAAGGTLLGFVYSGDRAVVPRAVARLLPIAAVLLLAACGGHTDALSTTAAITPVESNPQGFAQWNTAPPAYRFGPGDRLRVQFLTTPEMGEDALVAPDGSVGLRAAGHVDAGGRSATELEQDIARASRRVLANPVVTVSLSDPAAAQVYVGGQVKKPGAYPLTGRRGPLEGVLLAGGFEAEARVDEVVLIRRGPDNRPMLRTVNLKRFLSTGDDAGAVPLYPGDVVFVPRNRISEVDLWIDQFINKFVPFSKAFSYTINRNTPGFGA